jgi:hypothetical protein
VSRLISNNFDLDIECGSKYDFSAYPFPRHKNPISRERKSR